MVQSMYGSELKKVSENMFLPELHSNIYNIFIWVMWKNYAVLTSCHLSICIRYTSILENTTTAMLDEELLSPFVSDLEEEEFSGFLADFDNE